MQDHRKLKVWSRSHALAVAARKAVRSFPRAGYGTLHSQIIRAVESIPLNIAEGCGASSQKEFARYLSISIKSSSELQAQLELARDHGALPETKWKGLSDETVEIRRMVCGLRAKVLDSPGRTGNS